MVVRQLGVSAYRIPTEQPEADGTIHWDATTLVLVEVTADSGHVGLGFTYAAAAAATLIRQRLAPLVRDRHVHAVGAIWEKWSTRCAA